MANVSPQASATLGSFNAATAEDAKRDVLACCASRSFAEAVADGRPYPDADALLAAVDATFKALSWDDIVEAMDEHPRIGDLAVRGGQRRGPAGAGGRQPGLRTALRPYLPDLRQRPIRRGDAGPAAVPAGER
jgi:2-oxo-4-hydroxy-4-carboxy-5-ureidoimidazoline decarboxylase